MTHWMAALTSNRQHHEHRRRRTILWLVRPWQAPWLRLQAVSGVAVVLRLAGSHARQTRGGRGAGGGSKTRKEQMTYRAVRRQRTYCFCCVCMANCSASCPA